VEYLIRNKKGDGLIGIHGSFRGRRSDRRNRFFIAVLAGIFILASEDRGVAGELGLFVEQVVQGHPEIRAAHSRVRIAHAALRETRARSWPQARVQSVLTRGDHPVFVFGSLLQQRSFEAKHFDVGYLNDPGDLTDVSTSLEIGLPLFTGFEQSRNRQLADLGVRESVSRSRGTAQDLRHQAAEAYLTVILKKAQRAAVRERIDSAAQEMQSAQRLKAKGLILGSDFYAAESILEGLRAWEIQLAAEEQSAQAVVFSLAGGAGDIPSYRSRLSESLYEVGDLPLLEKEALENRDDIVLASHRTREAGLKSAMAGSSILPRVEAFASVASHTGDFSDHPADRLWGVRLGMALGDPSYPARRARSRAAEEEARANQESVRDRVKREVAQSLSFYQGAVSALVPVKKSRSLAAESLELFRPLYRSGRQSILDVLRAEEGLARADIHYLDALYRIHSGYLRLASSMGRLDEGTVSRLSDRLEVLP